MRLVNPTFSQVWTCFEAFLACFYNSVEYATTDHDTGSSECQTKNRINNQQLVLKLFVVVTDGGICTCVQTAKHQAHNTNTTTTTNTNTVARSLFHSKQVASLAVTTGIKLNVFTDCILRHLYLRSNNNSLATSKEIFPTWISFLVSYHGDVVWLANE